MANVHVAHEDFVATALALVLCVMYSAAILCVDNTDKIHIFV